LHTDQCHYDFFNLQISLDRILDWLKEHQLLISVRKCCCTVLDNIDMNDVHYSIDYHSVNTINKVRDLGVVTDSVLRFNSHMSYIIAKTRTCASLIHKRFCYATLKFCFAQLRSMSGHSSTPIPHPIIWPSYTLEEIEAVQKVFEEMQTAKIWINLQGSVIFTCTA